jgi:hypothetical protein
MVERTAQIVSDGPPGTVRCHWARTADQYGAEWLLVREIRDKVTGKVAYEASQAITDSAITSGEARLPRGMS